MPERGASAESSWLDLMPIGASGACVVHCLVLPLLLALVPALARVVEVPEAFHLAAFLLAVPASAVALIVGFRLHGAGHPAAIGTAGLLLLACGALAGLSLLLETGLTVLGSLILAAGHLRNWRLRARAGSVAAGANAAPAGGFNSDR